MNSCRSSRFSLSPTIVQSPFSRASCGPSTPVTPMLQVDMDRVPFSQSFPGIAKPPYMPDVSFPESGCAGVARINGGGILNRRDSFHIEHIRNPKAIDPEWEHDEIEEIMIISPKPRTRNSFLDLGGSRKLSTSDFEVLRVVGKDPSVQTILARSCSDFGIYAIKTLGKRTVSTPNLLKHVHSEQTCLRIVTEGNSPFLPKLHRSFQDEARLYMVLDAYPGGSIAMHLDREGPLAADKARFYACEMAEALVYLHSLQIVHRDVKPENVMIAADGHIVLTNFSYAKILDLCGSTASNCGTREFEAPERILGWSYNYSADVWSFGILLCIMHFGQHPFLEGDELDPLLIMQKRILRGQAPSHPSQMVPLSEWGLIKKCLERNSHLRPNMTQVQSDEYFSGIDWERIKSKEYPAPYIPYGDELDLLDIDEDIFHCYENSDLIELDNSPSTDVSDFDDFTFAWDATMPLPVLQTTFQSNSDSTDPETRCTILPGKSSKLRSILKSPSVYFAGDRQAADPVKPGDFLDLSHSPSPLSLARNIERPKKLRKKRLSSSDPQNTLLSRRKSLTSILNEIRVGKGGQKKAGESEKYLAGCESSLSSGTANLPKGINQSGRGIEFTYTPQGSRSRLSLSSTKTHSCFKGFSTLFGKYCGTTEFVANSGNEVMQRIYGSTWSVHSEAQLSTTTFGIPDGLGRRVDSIDMPAQQTAQT